MSRLPVSTRLAPLFSLWEERCFRMQIAPPLAVNLWTWGLGGSLVGL